MIDADYSGDDEYHETDESSSDGTHCHGEREEEPVKEQLLQDFNDFFGCDCQGLSYVFLGHSRADKGDFLNDLRPNAITALMLFDAIDYGTDAVRMDRWLAEDPNADVSDSPDSEVVAAVRERVEVMQSRGDKFVLVWRVAGDREVQVDCSGDFEDHRESLTDYIVSEVEVFVRC